MPKCCSRSRNMPSECPLNSRFRGSRSSQRQSLGLQLNLSLILGFLKNFTCMALWLNRVFKSYRSVNSSSKINPAACKPCPHNLRVNCRSLARGPGSQTQTSSNHRPKFNCSSESLSPTPSLDPPFNEQ